MWSGVGGLCGWIVEKFSGVCVLFLTSQDIIQRESVSCNEMKWKSELQSIHCFQVKFSVKLLMCKLVGVHVAQLEWCVVDEEADQTDKYVFVPDGVTFTYPQHLVLDWGWHWHALLPANTSHIVWVHEDVCWWVKFTEKWKKKSWSVGVESPSRRLEREGGV